MSLKDDIINLYTNYNYTITDIVKELGCSRDVVCYHTDADYRQLKKERIAKQRQQAKMNRPIVIKEVKARVKREKVIKQVELAKPMILKVDRRPKREERHILPNRNLNLDKKVLVRLNHKTEVYADPGYNIDKLRAKFKIAV